MLAVIASAYAVDFLIIREATSVALTGVPAIKQKKVERESMIEDRKKSA